MTIDSLRGRVLAARSVRRVVERTRQRSVTLRMLIGVTPLLKPKAVPGLMPLRSLLTLLAGAQVSTANLSVRKLPRGQWYGKGDWGNDERYDARTARKIRHRVVRGNPWRQFDIASK